MIDQQYNNPANRIFVKCVRPIGNSSVGSAYGKADGDKTGRLSSGIDWGATDSCDIPPTTFSQLIKLRTKPPEKDIV